ncbi:hypothetical protein HPP92_011175 [Vanilla planifolia]|uniref:Uncharacterized protein n=1 Tax=Vanilla planifolia TaxID=51239 RepID=A0A835R548_VANPL|nr:hypothetical protein HPP92_011175 [Vanilla planifolia]
MGHGQVIYVRKSEYWASCFCAWGGEFLLAKVPHLAQCSTVSKGKMYRNS